jgi:predicted RNase H-like nuclease
MAQPTAQITGIIGVDCATQAQRVGLALASYRAGSALVERVFLGSRVDSIVRTTADWATRFPRTLVALDAPLGWPAALGPTLHGHEAGGPIDLEANRIFRRTTDTFVKQVIGKQPLDVGSNWIARTAHAALSFLQELRQHTGEAIPLAWTPEFGPGLHAIEVYPAATLQAYNVAVPGYKGPGGQVARQTILRFLAEQVNLPEDLSPMEFSDDALDAALCVLAGADFARGRALEPTDLELARVEGWIWVREPASRASRRR